ncbi:hypothetical protein AgCh_037822 [Apium graveolens]
MQKFGGQLLIIDFDILWNAKKEEPTGTGVCDLPNDACKISEAVMNNVYLGAELDSPDWTPNYVKVHVLNVEVIQILKAYKYRVWRQDIPEMDKDSLNRKELCENISFDRASTYSGVLQTANSNYEIGKVQEWLRLYVTLKLFC